MNDQLAAPRPEPERYVTARELAAIMGISATTVKQLVIEGMPSETWGLKRTRRFLPSEAMAWARRKRIGTIDETRDRTQSAPGQSSREE